MSLKNKNTGLTPDQCDDVFETFAELVRIKDLDVEDLDTYFKPGSESMTDFFIQELEYIDWFDYAIHAQPILNDIESYIAFYQDDVEFVNDDVCMDR